jgi:hypothetical protein
MALPLVRRLQVESVGGERGRPLKSRLNGIPLIHTGKSRLPDFQTSTRDNTPVECLPE